MMNRPKPFAAFVVSLVIWCSPARSQTDEGPRVVVRPAPSSAFGGRGQLAISSDFEMSFHETWTSVGGSNAQSTSTQIALAPSADFFVLKGFSLGGQLIYAHSSGAPTPDSATYGVGGRVGLSFNASDTVSWWPRLGCEYASVRTDPRSSAESELVTTRFTLVFSAPVLVQPAPHFFLGMGPTLSVDLAATSSEPASNRDSASGSKSTQFGIGFLVGGWMLGD